ncbi:MAG: LTA synthase family protein [Bacteroidales bacterium]|nr:LTA synthase family protein [Bacteroidales bacterium]
MKASLYVQLIKRILVVYLLFTLCRLVFYGYHHSLYQERSVTQLAGIFAGGLLFDTTAILYTNLPYLLMFLIPFRFRYCRGYQTAGKYLYFTANGVALAANCMDTVYFGFTMRRTTFGIFREFSHGENIGGVMLRALADNWYMALFFAGLVALMVWLYGAPFKRSSILLRNAWAYYPVGLLVMALSVGVMVVGLRGGARHSVRPITLSNAGEYAHEPVDVPLVLNTPFSLYKTVERKGITPLRYFDDPAEADSIYTPVHLPPDSGAFNRMNVMVLILESFGKEHWGFYNTHLEGGNYRGYTPFLDSIADQSLTFEYSYGNGGKSIDALASSMASIPAIPEPFVLSPYFDNHIRALPLLLREKGYETAFFCGQPNSAMGFWAFCKLTGFNRQFGMSEYGNKSDYDGIWGIWDEEFLQFTAREMSSLPEPFLATLFTVSSHHPFDVPERYENTFEAGPLPIHRCIRYTDYSLRRFFKTASQQPWYHRTLFVLMADHINGTVHDEYKPAAERFAVPIIFFRPDGSLKSYQKTVAQQIDVMPTVLGLLHYDAPYFAFGFDLTRTPDRFAVNYNNGYYQLYADKYMLSWDGKETTGLFELHAGAGEDLKERLPRVREKMERKIQAFLQQYTACMVENRLTVKPQNK